MTEYEIRLFISTFLAFWFGWGCRISYTEWDEKKRLEAQARIEKYRQEEETRQSKMSIIADRALGRPVYGAKRVEGRWFVRLSDTDKTYSELSGLLASN